MPLSFVTEDRQREPYTLRPRQAEAVDLGSHWLMHGPKKMNAMMVLPTGYGKSLIAANIVRRLDGPCLISQPSKEILEQNQEKLRDYGFEPAVFSASKGKKDISPITLVTIGSIWKNPELFQHFKYWIPDECHRLNPTEGIYRSFMNKLPHIRLLGLTATPIRLATNSEGAILRWLNRMVPRIFNEMIYHVQLADAFREGHLAKYEYYTIPGIDKTKLRLNTTGAEYDDKSVQLHLSEIHFEDKIVKVVMRALARGRKSVLVFTQSVAESNYVTERLLAAGVRAAVVTAETKPGARRDIGKAFKAGQIQVVSNVGVYTCGYDYPELDTVVIARPTKSLTLAYQMMGRGARPHASKESCWLVDMVGVIEQFGKLEDLTIRTEGGRKYYFASGHRQLTNVYFGEASSRGKFFANKYKRNKTFDRGSGRFV